MKLLLLLLLISFSFTNSLAQIAYVRGGTEIRIIDPDGQNDERAKTIDKDQEADLWIVGVDGGNMRLLVRNGFEPSWAR